MGIPRALNLKESNCCLNAIEFALHHKEFQGKFILDSYLVTSIFISLNRAKAMNIYAKKKSENKIKLNNLNIFFPLCTY